VASSITGTSVTRAGGGGSGTGAEAFQFYGGTGGGGKGANGYYMRGADSGTVNTGGGGGGGSLGTYGAGQGGSGIVILRYPALYTITLGAGLTGTTSTVGQNKVTTITSGTGQVSFT
jgi:hypothetical protein